MDYKNVMEWAGEGVDAAGVLVIVAGLLAASVAGVRRLGEGPSVRAVAYREYRQGIGRVILLGLEFLVAGDIVRTVAVTPTLQSVFVLGVIVLIRTCLSMSLELELEGRWPWERAENTKLQTPNTK